MSLQQRSYQAELLDQPDIPFAAIRQNMRELEVINSLLGGHRITIAGLAQLVGNRTRIHICEIGCGGGDNLAALKKWCHQKHIEVSFTGVDMKEACIDVAQQKKELQSCTNWIISDYRQVHFNQQPPDIIFSSLFCHHFTDADLMAQLQWMKQNSRIGFFINDLHRHPLAYYSIRWLTKIFSRSYLVKNDAPLSVARGFKRKEWLALLRQAGVDNAVVEWKWAFRWLITWSHPKQ